MQVIMHLHGECYKVFRMMKGKRVENSTQQDNINKGTKQTQNSKIIEG